MKYNILHIVATGKLSGAEKVVLDICTNLNKDLFNVTAVSSGIKLQELYSKNYIKTWIININRLNPIEILKIRKLIKNEKIDLIHAHDVKASIASAIAANSMKIPVISHLHGNYLWMKDNTIMKNVDRHYRKKYTLNIACSNEVETFYKENNASFEPNRMITLGNAFNFRELYKSNIKDKDTFKTENNLPKDKYVFGYIGRLIRLKGVDLLLKSFAGIASENQESILIIVGDGEEKENLISLAKNLGISNRVYFMGFRQDVYDFLNIFDAFIIPSEIEGLPMVILEAMAMRKAIISTPVGGIPEVIKNNLTGILLEDRNLESLINAMNNICKNPEFAATLGNNAKTYLLENRDLSIYVDNLEKIYIDLINEKN